jgi:hypothetical protein
MNLVFSSINVYHPNHVKGVTSMLQTVLYSPSSQVSSLKSQRQGLSFKSAKQLTEKLDLILNALYSTKKKKESLEELGSKIERYLDYYDTKVLLPGESDLSDNRTFPILKERIENSFSGLEPDLVLPARELLKESENCLEGKAYSYLKSVRTVYVDLLKFIHSAAFNEKDVPETLKDLLSQVSVILNNDASKAEQSSALNPLYMDLKSQKESLPAENTSAKWFYKFASDFIGSVDYVLTAATE